MTAGMPVVETASPEALAAYTLGACGVPPFFEMEAALC